MDSLDSGNINSWQFWMLLLGAHLQMEMYKEHERILRPNKEIPKFHRVTFPNASRDAPSLSFKSGRLTIKNKRRRQQPAGLVHDAAAPALPALPMAMAMIPFPFHVAIGAFLLLSLIRGGDHPK